MDARTSYFSNEIKDLQFKFKSLRNDHERLKKDNEVLDKRIKVLEKILLEQPLPEEMGE